MRTTTITRCARRRVPDPLHESPRVPASDLYDVAALLVAEFGGRLSTTTVIRQLARVREELLAAGVPANAVPAAAESLTRQRLSSTI